MSAQRITVYLLQANISKFEEAIDPEKQGQRVDIEPSTGVSGCFYYSASTPSTPRWVNFLQPLVSLPAGSIQGASATGLLLLKTSGRVFALTFGYGRSLLDLSKIEYQFGLRVVLNRINPSQIRSVDTKTYDDVVLSTNSQTSKSVDLPTFSIDITRDILRSVAGEPKDSSISKKMAGSDSLVISIDMDILEIPKLCDDLLEWFLAEDYKDKFGWIDHLSLVRDRALVEKLNNLLVEELRTGNPGATHLAMPEPIGWEDIDGFTVAGTRGHMYEDLDLDEYLGLLGDECSKITLDRLKSRSVAVRFSRSGNLDKRWNLYQCIVSEQRVSGKLHVLIEGRWFAVSSTLVEEVDSFAHSLDDSQLVLPESLPGETEPQYNARVVDEDPSNFLLLDGATRRPSGASSGIEFCDIMSAEGDLIHVKKRSKSATLSHLFAQGKVSATTFVSDGVFRDRLRELIVKAAPIGDHDKWLTLVPGGGESVVRDKYRVIYVVIVNSSRGENNWLPFFSKLNLMQQGRQLLSMGFGVSVARVSFAPDSA